MLVAISSSGILLFIFCHFGKMATDAFFSFGDYAYQTEWYTIPIKKQQYFQLIIQIAQNPLCYKGFGINLDLQTFSAVWNLPWSFAPFISWNFNCLSVNEICCQLLHDVQNLHFLSILNFLLLSWNYGTMYTVHCTHFKFNSLFLNNNLKIYI